MPENEPEETGSGYLQGEQSALPGGGWGEAMRRSSVFKKTEGGVCLRNTLS